MQGKVIVVVREPGIHVWAASKGVSRPRTQMPDEWLAAQMKEV